MKKITPFLLIISFVLVSCKPAEAPQTQASASIPAKPQEVMQKNPAEDKLVFQDRMIVMETNYGVLHIKMLDKAAPKTAENFIRLTSRGYFDGVVFHRMVVGDSMKIIQGGDPTGTGRGGESAWGGRFEDEVYKPGTKDFVDAELYGSFNGQYAMYKKGWVAMANAGANTNGSQFFIMLGDTKLPPAYTIFGTIQDQDLPVLEKILAEVKPDSPLGDGKPNKELKMVKVSLEE